MAHVSVFWHVCFNNTHETVGFLSLGYALKPTAADTGVGAAHAWHTFVCFGTCVLTMHMKRLAFCRWATLSNPQQQTQVQAQLMHGTRSCVLARGT